MRLSRVVMAHSSRRTHAETLADQLDASIVWDEGEDIWGTARRALLAHGDATHHLVIQDDAIISQRLVEAVTEIVTAHPTFPINLYFGTKRPNPARFRPWIMAATDTGSSLIEAPGPWWGVACVYPTDHIAPLVEYGDRYKNVGQSYDGRATAYYSSIKQHWLFAWPSLVDHDTGIPSLHSSTMGRRAVNFIGTGRTGVGSDWSKVQHTTPSALHPPVMFEHGPTGRRRKVGKFTREWDRLNRHGTWRVVE